MRISDWSSDVCSSDLAGAIIALVLQLVGDQPAGQEQRAKDRPIIMMPGAILGQRLDALILVIDRWQGAPARRDVGKSAGSAGAGRQHRMARPRILAIAIPAARDAVRRSFGDGGETPYRQAPRRAAPRNAIPIALVVSEQPRY